MRLDSGFAVSVVSCYMHAPSTEHLKAVYRILRSLKKALGQGIMYSMDGNVDIQITEIFIDANWAVSKTDKTSTTRYCALVGANLVSWKSKKQGVVALSSSEEEYHAMAHGTNELLW